MKHDEKKAFEIWKKNSTKFQGEENLILIKALVYVCMNEYAEHMVQQREKEIINELDNSRGCTVSEVLRNLINKEDE